MRPTAIISLLREFDMAAPLIFSLKDREPFDDGTKTKTKDQHLTIKRKIQAHTLTSM